MKVINMHEAKTTLSQLVEQALKGETIVIARRGVPVVTLEPVKQLRPIGLGSHLCEHADYSDWELFSDTNPDVYEENPNDPLNITDVK